MLRKVNLAIQRYQHEIRSSALRTKILKADMVSIIFGAPDSKRCTSHKNPKYRDGTVLQCTGYDSKDHFYKECKNPHKTKYRERRFAEINSIRGK